MSDRDGLRDETLSRLYRESATAQPPPGIDAAIVAAARAEVGLNRVRRPSPAWRRWRMAVSFAAVATFAFALSMIVPREMERAEQAFPQEAAAPAPAPVPPPAPAAAPAPTPTQPAPQAGASASARDASAAPAGAVGRSAPLPGMPQRQEKANRSAPEPQTESRATPVQPSARSTENARTRREDFAVEANPWPGAPKAQPDKVKGIEAESRPLAAGVSPTVAAPREGGVPAPAPAARAAPAPEPQVQGEKKGTAADGMDNAASPPGGVPRALKQEESEWSPTQWLAEIRRLYRQGRKEEATDALAAFRRTYPGHSIPEDLRPLER